MADDVRYLVHRQFVLLDGSRAALPMRVFDAEEQGRHFAAGQQQTVLHVLGAQVTGLSPEPMNVGQVLVNLGIKGITHGGHGIPYGELGLIEVVGGGIRIPRH